MRLVFIALYFCFITSFCNAQTIPDSPRISIEYGGHGDPDARPAASILEPAVITGIKSTSPRLTSLHIERYDLSELEKKSPYNLSDALAQLPGISQLTTGNAISKPVIRGLYGNRVLVLLSGLRFDNQQFQDEHGLGLTQIGINRVEIIRGPASILYGTDAVGGVINVIEEGQLYTNGTYLDGGMRLYSNTLGTLTDVGIVHQKATTWWRIRGGYESHADYTDGAGSRVLDSRNTGYYLKAGYGFSHTHWENSNNYNLSFNQFGFILDSPFNTQKTDGRWSRTMQNPHHNVLLNTLSSQNTFYIHRYPTTADYESSRTAGAILKINGGFQSNHRAEDEGGGEISLDMHLLSVLESARIEKYLSQKLLLIGSQQTTYEHNTNYGKRILIPDASMLENTVSVFLRQGERKLIIEAGAGVTYKNIQTYYTGPLNAPGKAVLPFSKLWTGYNLLGGVSYNPSSSVNVKGNLSTGLRAPNLAESSSDGLHEGTYRYEIGNPNLRMENIVSGDVTIEKSARQFFISASAYVNAFQHYIYLVQTPDTVLGLFPLFRYQQQAATLYGGEISGTYRPTSHVTIKESFSVVRGITGDGLNLPFIPPPKNLFSVQYRFRSANDAKPADISIEPEAEYNFRYTRTGPFETENPAYLLINLHTSGRFGLRHHFYTGGISVRNLLNSTYADALSRLRYYGINNCGINVVFSLRTTINPARH